MEISVPASDPAPRQDALNLDGELGFCKLDFVLFCFVLVRGGGLEVRRPTGAWVALQARQDGLQQGGRWALVKGVYAGSARLSQGWPGLLVSGLYMRQR